MLPAMSALYDFDAKHVWQVTITIADIEPAIWRRLLVPEGLNFAQLHEVIQAAFGWTDSHLHHFIVGGLVVGAPEFDEDGLNQHQTLDAATIHLHDLMYPGGDQPPILYEYDFGDSWHHWIVFDQLIPEKPGEIYPQILDGGRSAPPEDVGGPPGYQDFLHAWHDPTHVEHKSVRSWAGKRFDPEAFDRDKIQKAITSALRRCKGDYRFRKER
jgi:hypothetical protein